MTVSLIGIGVSRGIAMGAVHILERDQPDITELSLAREQVEDEVRRLETALSEARADLREIRNRIPSSTAGDIASFIDAHLLMLKDSALTKVPEEIIRRQHCNAEWALKLQRDALVAVFEEMDDAYLRTRKDDIAHVVNQVLRILTRSEHDKPETAAASLRDSIVIADDLAPAEVVMLQHQGVAGLVTEFGGPLSHTAIMARSLRMPAVVGVHRARRYLMGEELVILDGREGVLLAEPDEAALRHYRALQRQDKQYFAGLQRLKGKPAVTTDGQAVALHANIELPEDLELVRQAGPDGIGLYRTEFLYMNRQAAPDEEEQLAAYVAVVQALRGKPVTIRTLDLGADKTAGPSRSTPGSANPALGLRAIRLCLKDLALFKPQLRAILRASAQGPVRLMVPMLSCANELFQILRLLDEVREELRNQDLAFDPHMPVGAMIEVPAAALSATTFARHLDFMSIGTNDLIQYTLAIDRVDEEVVYLYDPLHPAVLRLIHQTLKAGQRANIPVSMCGEMAGDGRYTRLLLGLGLREFSMHPSSLLEIKSIIKHTALADVGRLTRSILQSHHPERTLALLHRLNNQ